MCDKDLNDISYSLNLLAFLEFRKECKKFNINCNVDYCLNECCYKDNVDSCVDCFKTFKKLVK